jgi:hypothetical protein
LHIPNELLEAAGPRYQVMLFWERAQMESERATNNNSTNTPPRNVGLVGDIMDQGTEITNDTNANTRGDTQLNEDDKGASGQFGSSGRNKKQ